MSSLGIVITKLGQTGAVTAITGSAGIYPVDFPQGASPPCVVANIVSGVDEPFLEGAAKFWRGVVTVECLASTADVMVSLAEAVIEALNGTKNATIAGHTDVSILKGGTDFTDKSDDRSTYRRTVDFKVRWR
ncbi:hypothetical protein MesoLjLc_50560 [Mesorhizobium sp. L-8-10]|uniref:tail completion protein gp17 n=1 Tax=Mesorhizobium sp. L-8-10 TaxID=2744523 RepID=UPI0019283056|nr:DUF3168 domain-containing protein [Mesorhizobium sp. L-8-10]BCH33126.1 hypothetical protein MesoLjLc_50560 [Mesorhizobium sp. L-8-10]